VNAASPPAPNIFALTPYHTPKVIGFLYWLCAWADSRHQKTSGELHQAGGAMLRFLLCGVGGVTMASFNRVELVNHLGPESEVVCFLRVNGTHALLLSEMENQDDGSEGERIGYWGDDGLNLIPICCEELHVRWQRVETTLLTLTTRRSDNDMHYLSLVQLCEAPIFSESTGHGIHPLLDDFRLALLANVKAEQLFREIPLKQWNLQAWRGFYKLLAASFGGEWFSKPLGALWHPFCQIQWKKGPMELCFEDAKLSVVLHGPLPPMDKLFHLRLLLEQDAAAALGFCASLHGYEIREIACHLKEFMPPESHQQVMVPLFQNFLLLDANGLVDIAATLDRLIAAREFLSLSPRDSGSFASLTEEMMIWLNRNQNLLGQTTRSQDTAGLALTSSGGVICECLVERLIEHALKECTVIPPQEIRAIWKVIGIHVAGIKTRHFDQFGPDPQVEGALQETK
jgi:hypothetical protein